MANFRRAEPVAENRRMECECTEDDGVTLVPAGTAYTGVAATRKLAGASSLAGAIAQLTVVGVAGAISITFVNDGAGTGTITQVSTAFTVHFQAGVTRISDAQALMLPHGIQLTGTFTPSATLAAGDAFGPLKFAGGEDPCIYVRQGGTTWVAAEGTFTGTDLASVPIPGDYVYEATQDELDFSGNEFGVRVAHPPTPASLDIATVTSGVCDTVIYDKTAVGSAGNTTTIEFADDGAGAGTLDESGYPVVVFHFQHGVTLVSDFEAAVFASTNLGIKQYGTWSLVLAVGDAFAAESFSGGRSYQTQIFRENMDLGSLNSTVENGYSGADYLRLMVAVMVGVTTGYSESVVTVSSPDGSKLRATVVTDDDGRNTVTLNTDLS